MWHREQRGRNDGITTKSCQGARADAMLKIDLQRKVEGVELKRTEDISIRKSYLLDRDDSDVHGYHCLYRQKNHSVICAYCWAPWGDVAWY